MSTNSEPMVFLEDLMMPKRGSASSAGTAVVSSQGSDNGSNKGKATSDGAKTGEKRQGAIDTFFASKKLKTADGTSASASGASGSGLASRPFAGTGRSPQKLNSIPFSLSAFKDSMNAEQLELLSLECETMSPIWLKILADEIKKPSFIKLKQYLREEGIKAHDDPNPNRDLKVFPPAPDIYSWSRFTPLGKVRVVILGQDPYQTPKFAHGLSFSVQHGIRIPQSLGNIYKEVKNTYPEFTAPRHGNLEEWAKQGVLMLNTCLTVRPSVSNSHQNQGWEQFTTAVLQAVDKYGGAALRDQNGVMTGVGRGVVFIAWGKPAQKCVEKLNKSKHLILQSPHPSPYSADKGFFGNGHFRKANEWLVERYGSAAAIDWTRLDPVPVEVAAASSTNTEEV